MLHGTFIFRELPAVLHQFFSGTTPLININNPSTMANENGGVFSDLFNAFGALVQSLADTLTSSVSSASTVVQSCTELCVNIVTNTANTALQLVQNVANGISSAITPKK
ncbi:hypothetical protein CferDRAFT_0760 [Chlorobium ferrooxidans DSM 13031]|uniref:Chlorosome envelope protein B n=2 Tax=Chlorobium/Pelodictyon group TaxID=274493 RepID=Q0YQZ9_9CHLB|nr:hypothetical protein CferDRAFT_0760 [Chlorobium ferrooxidans DSM 13031]